MTEQERSDIALIDQGGKDNNIFAYLPVERRTEEVCRHAVEKSVYNIWYVPEHLQTEDICLSAVQSFGCSLFYIPLNLKTPTSMYGSS